MTLEARSVTGAALKRKLLGKVWSCKSELHSLIDKYNQHLLMAGASKSDSGGHREQLLQPRHVKNQNSQLDNAQKVLEETEQVALEIGMEWLHN